MRAWGKPGTVGIRIGPLVFVFHSREHRPLFSERNRIRCRVMPLPRGWRLIARWNPTRV